MLSYVRDMHALEIELSALLVLLQLIFGQDVDLHHVFVGWEIVLVSMFWIFWASLGLLPYLL